MSSTKSKHWVFLHISTDEVYGDVYEGDNKENAVMNPTNPYSASKAAIDLIIKSYQYSYKLPITILRPNNVYGPLKYPENHPIDYTMYKRKETNSSSW